VESALDGHFEQLKDSQYKLGIQAIQRGWQKSIKLKGDYVEKSKYVFVRLATFGPTLVHKIMYKYDTCLTLCKSSINKKL
jgi:hypothetical protein